MRRRAENAWSRACFLNYRSIRRARTFRKDASEPSRRPFSNILRSRRACSAPAVLSGRNASILSPFLFFSFLFA
jgi:hypothetical protein